MNKVFKKGEKLQTMMEDLNYFRKEKRIWDKLLLEGIMINTEREIRRKLREKERKKEQRKSIYI